MSDNTTPAKEAAEIAKLNAETRQIELDTLLAERLTLAEIARTEAEAAKEAHNAAMAAITRAERERVEELTMVQDHYAFHHYLDGSVNEKFTYGALNTFNAWHRLYPESAWTIDINSPGGDVVDGMHLFDALTAYSIRGGGAHHITMTVRGYAASMAGILLQAADRRVIGSEAYLMIHEIAAGTGGKIGEIRDDVKWYDKVCERIANLFVQRSGGRISLEDFKASWERHDWWLDSNEALELGFVDAIG